MKIAPTRTRSNAGRNQELQNELAIAKEELAIAQIASSVETNSDSGEKISTGNDSCSPQKTVH